METDKLCSKCKQRPARSPKNNQPWCKLCYSTAEKARRKKLKAAGTCYDCGANPQCADTRGVGSSKRLSNICSDCSAKRKARSNQQRLVNKLRAINHFGGTCFDCGLKTDHTEVYDFHHLDPTQKKFTVARRMQGTWERILPELIKCILLCSNCHRIREYALEQV